MKLSVFVSEKMAIDIPVAVTNKSLTIGGAIAIITSRLKLPSDAGEIVVQSKDVSMDFDCKC